MPDFPPITHVAVTVTDLERSTRWYSELLGGGPVPVSYTHLTLPTTPYV